MLHEAKEKFKDILGRNLDVFAWGHNNMVGIDPKVNCHHLKIDSTIVPHRQKMRVNLENFEALKKEMQKLIENDFIRKAIFPK